MAMTMENHSIPVQDKHTMWFAPARSSGTTADVGLAYYNSQGKYIINSKTSLSGYDSYGTVSATPTFKNYGYVKNTGSAKLTASYVYMK